MAKPNLHRAGPGGGKNIKGGAKALSLGLSLPRACARALSLSLSPPPHALLHSLLFESWILLLSSKENAAVTLICLRAVTQFVQDPRAVMRRGL